jgi:shikimate dehydrogenase
MRTLGLAGLSVTMPHKVDVVGEVDSLGPVAARLGVANTIAWKPSQDGGELVGDSTDGEGFIDALRDDDGFDPSGMRCLVLGSGGAARAVTLALGDAGASSVAVAGRRLERAEDCAALAGGRGTGVASQSHDLGDLILGADLVVNATSVGMYPGDGLPFGIDPGWFNENQFVVDLTYSPATTPFLEGARRQGSSWSNGLGMLIHQAARQIEMWTGRPAPLEAMSAAAVAALAHRGR